jgi:pectinesterase
MQIFTPTILAFAGLATAAAETICTGPDSSAEVAVGGTSDSVCNGPNARTKPPAGAIVVDVTGAYNGSFRNVSEGVAHIPNTTDEHTLFLFPGVYHEQVFVPKLNGPLVVQGYTCNTMRYSQNEVTLTNTKAQKDIPPEIEDNRNFLTSTMGFKSSSGVKMYNVIVANPAGKIEENGQAVAVYVDSSDYGFYACNFTGYQDTLCAQKGRELYARSFISGAVDFVFGQKAMAWFESCDLESIGEGWVTANGNANGTVVSEYVFNKAHVFGSSGEASTYLGRPWGEYARVVFQNSNMSDVVNSTGWSTWDDGTSTENVYLKEFENSGPGAATDKRVDFSGQLNASVAITEILGDDYASQWWVDANFL